MVKIGNQHGFSFIGLLFKLAVLLFILYLLNRFYTHVIFNREMRQFMGREGISTSSMKDMFESFRGKADEISRIFSNREKEIDQFLKEGK